MLNPDYVTEVRWWENPAFHEKLSREASEIIALQLLDPALRSRGSTTEDARKLSSDPKFKQKMTSLFKGPPSGIASVPTLQTALDRIVELERRLTQLEKEASERG